MNMNLQLKRNPKVLPGDIIRSLNKEDKGALMIVREAKYHGKDEYTEYQLSVSSMPGQPSHKSAWWSDGEWEMYEKGLAHQYWNRGVEVEVEKVKIRENEGNIEWVIGNWQKIKPDLHSGHITTILSHTRLIPDVSGLMLKGEIGIATMLYIEKWNVCKDAIVSLIEDGTFFDAYPVR